MTTRISQDKKGNTFGKFRVLNKNRKEKHSKRVGISTRGRENPGILSEPRCTHAYLGLNESNNLSYSANMK